MKPLRIAIMYGSQTGNAQSIEESLDEGCKGRGLDSSLLKCDAWKKMTPELKEWSAVVFLVSTTGNGDPPENAERFWRFLKRRSHPNDLLAGLPFALLGLGDTNYDKFCYMGKSLDKRLRELGAVPFHAPAFADEATNMEETIEPWTESLYQCLEALRSGGGDGFAQGTAKAKAHAKPKDSGALAPAQEGPSGEISVETPSSAPNTDADDSVAPRVSVVVTSSVTSAVTSASPKSSEDGVVISTRGVSAAATTLVRAHASLATPRAPAEVVAPSPSPALVPALETLRGVGEHQDPGVETPLPDHGIAVMYGSQTGNAQSIAERIYEGCKERGFNATLLACDGWKKMTPALTELTALVLVMSTTGNGDPPENAERFWRFLKRRSQPKDLLQGLPFTVLGLGDTNYDKFCYMGKSLSKRLRELGAAPFHSPAFADEATNMEETIEPWINTLFPALEIVIVPARATASDVPTGGDSEGTGSFTTDALEASVAAVEAASASLAPTVTMSDVPRVGEEIVALAEVALAAVDPGGVSAREAIEPDHQPGWQTETGLSLSSAEPPSDLGAVPTPMDHRIEEEDIVHGIDPTEVAIKEAAVAAVAAATAAEFGAGSFHAGPGFAVETSATAEVLASLGFSESIVAPLSGINGDVLEGIDQASASEGAPPVAAPWTPRAESGAKPLSYFLSADHLQPGYAPPRGELPSLRAAAPDVDFVSLGDGECERRRASSVESRHTFDQPFGARVLGARYLTEGGREAERRVILMELALEGSGISYEPGDVVGVRCPNSVEATAYILERLQVTLPPDAGPDVPFHHAMRSMPSPCTLREAFSSLVDLQTPLRRPMLRALAEFCEDAQERAWMELLCANMSGAGIYRNFVAAQSLTLCELLEAFPSCKPRPGPLLALLPPLPPRYYSVASSQLATPGSLTVAFSVVSHRLLIPTSTAGRGEGVTEVVGHEECDSPGSGDDRCLTPEEDGEVFLVTRRGLCTNWLEDMLKPLLSPGGDGGRAGIPVIPVFMKPAKEFLLPASAKWPCVLIGPGTGVSPFIGFLKHREEQLARRREMLDAVCSGYWRGGYEIALEGEEDETAAYRDRQGRGDMWLFFGCRNEKQDWIFRPEMEEFLSKGTLSRLTTAFSRDTHQKIYVQDRIREAGKDLSRLMLQEGAYVYVCGDGNAMAQGVHRTLVEVLAEHGNGIGGKEGAERALRGMKERNRYVLDVWS